MRLVIGHTGITDKEEESTMNIGTRVIIPATLGKSVEGTVTDTLRRGAVSYVEWDNGNSEWYDTRTLRTTA